jgi:hypothetical protein
MYRAGNSEHGYNLYHHEQNHAHGYPSEKMEADPHGYAGQNGAPPQRLNTNLSPLPIGRHINMGRPVRRGATTYCTKKLTVD